MFEETDLVLNTKHFLQISQNLEFTYMQNFYTVIRNFDSVKFRIVLCLKPVFHFARIVAKRTGEHAQIEKRFINPRTSGCIRVSK
jgi:hypothetical protein